MSTIRCWSNWARALARSHSDLEDWKAFSDFIDCLAANLGAGRRSEALKASTAKQKKEVALLSGKMRKLGKGPGASLADFAKVLDELTGTAASSIKKQ